MSPRPEQTGKGRRFPKVNLSKINLKKIRLPNLSLPRIQRQQRKEFQIHLPHIQLEDLHLPRLWSRTRRGVLYTLVLVLSILAQDGIFSHIRLFGVRAMFIPALVVAMAMWEGGVRGGWFGLAAGILTDLTFTGGGVLFTVLLPVTGFVTGFLSDFVLNRRFSACALLCVPALLAAAVAQMFGLLVFQGQNPWALWGTAILQTLWSLPFCVPFWFICQAIPREITGQVPSPY